MAPYPLHQLRHGGAEQLLRDTLWKYGGTLSSNRGEGVQREAGLGPGAQTCPSEGAGEELPEVAREFGGQMHTQRAHRLPPPPCGCNGNSSYDYGAFSEKY